MTIATARNAMTTDNRTNEPTPEQVEAAAKAAYEYAQENATVPMPRREWESLGWIERGLFEGEARAALEAAARAAQGAAPQEHPTMEEIGEDIARGIRDSLSGVAPQEPSLSNSEILERIAEQEREAAGAPAPQEPNQTETKSGNNFVSLDPEKVAAQGAAPQAESNPTSSYISPSLPGMIRNLWKSDPSENSVRTALKLAGDLIQELIDLKASAVLPSSGVDEDALAEAWEAGCLAGRNRKHHTNMTEEQAEKAWPNPYRAGDGESRG